MAGIAGFYEIRPSSSEEAHGRIASMTDQMKVVGESRKDFYAAEGVGIGRRVRDTLQPKSQPVTDRTGRYQAVLVGYIANGDELWATIDPQILGDAVKCDATLALAHYLQHGMDGLNRLNGVFASAIYDTAEHELTLFTDRYGYENVYYTWDGKELVFSSEFDLVVHAANTGRDVDFDGVADMLTYHFAHGTRTMVKNVNLLPHAAHCKVRSGGFELKQYWDYPAETEIHHGDVEEFIEPTVAHVDQAVKRISSRHDNLAVPLSAGLDSRIIIGLQEAREAHAFHIGSPDSRSAALSRMIAETVNVPWTLIDNRNYDHRQINATFDKFTDGTVSGEMCMHLPMIELLGEHYPSSVAVDGLCLDMLLHPTSAFQFDHEIDKGKNAAGFVEAVYQGYAKLGQYLADEIFEPSMVERIRQRRYRSVEETLQSFPNGDAWERTRYFYFVNRGRRLIHGRHSMYSAICEFMFPGLDYDLFDYCAHIPHDYLKRAQLCRLLVEKMNPKLAEVPWDLTGLPLAQNQAPARIWMDAKLANLKYYMARITRGKIDLYQKKTSADRMFRHNKEFRSLIMGILDDPRTFSRGIIDERGWRKLVSLQDSGKDFFPVIWAIIAVEKFFRRVMDD